MTMLTSFSQGAHPLSDGRQSDRAMRIRLGVLRLAFDLGASAVPEVPLKNGRRADILLLMPKNRFWIIEIKSSIADLRADAKWPDYRAYCDRLFFATLPDVPSQIFPDDAGFIVADRYGADILNDAPEHMFAGASRRALLERFARLAGQRLMRAEMAGPLALSEMDGDEADLLAAE